jgi:hypothetical protein
MIVFTAPVSSLAAGHARENAIYGPSPRSIQVSSRFANMMDVDPLLLLDGFHIPDDDSEHDRARYAGRQAISRSSRVVFLIRMRDPAPARCGRWHAMRRSSRQGDCIGS